MFDRSARSFRNMAWYSPVWKLIAEMSVLALKLRRRALGRGTVPRRDVGVPLCGWRVCRCADEARAALAAAERRKQATYPELLRGGACGSGRRSGGTLEPRRPGLFV